MKELPFIKCPACKKITLSQIVSGNAIVCSNPDCQVIFDKNYKIIGVFKNGKAIYDSVEDIRGGSIERHMLSIPNKNYTLHNISNTIEKTVIFIENAETGKILKAGDILPKFLMIKISL